jgi:sialic acid synthase SpsE
VTTGELKTLVEGIRYIERIQSHPVDKDLLSAELKPLKEIFSRSLFANKHLRKGDIIRKDDLAAKKPGIGIPAMQIKNLVGKRLMHDVPSGRMLKKDDIEDF